MNLGVIGAGYVGLTTAVCLASIGHKISIFEINRLKAKQLENKNIPFYEEGIKELFEKVTSMGNLEISESLDYMVRKTEGCFICVGTPTGDNESIDLSQVIGSMNSLIEAIKNVKKNNYTIIIRSTVVPLTTRNKLLPLLKNLNGLQITLCVVPEFLREGQALNDFMNPDKIVIGSTDESGEIFVKKIFDHFKDNVNFIITNPETAEMIKYTNNAFFSTLISFSNEIANISEKIHGVDAFQVMDALISDKRITIKTDNQKIVPYLSTYLLPGCGFGGSCFPKDVKALTQHAVSLGTKTPLLNAVLEINEERVMKITSLAEFLLGNLKGKQISILGLAFKPDTDDIRSSPAIEGIRMLQEKGANISAYDPKVNPESIIQIGINDVIFHENLEECLKNSVLAILFTKWPEFRTINGEFLSKHMINPIIIDGRGYLDRNQFQKKTYYKIGYAE